MLFSLFVWRCSLSSARLHVLPAFDAYTPNDITNFAKLRNLQCRKDAVLEMNAPLLYIYSAASVSFNGDLPKA